MMIDMNAWVGFWGTTPISFDVRQIRSALHEIGVDRILLSVMHAVWCQNPHLCNDIIYRAAEDYPDVDPVPVLDLTIPTWRDELSKARKAPRARWVKMAPTYSSYTLESAGEFLDTLARMGLGAIIQTRMEDPRRQHPRAQVPDTPVREIVEAAERHPDTNIIIGGGTLSALLEASDAIRKQPNLYADISQVDGIWGIKPLVEAGLTNKLLFGSHAPFFLPLAALAKVLFDLDEATMIAVLSGNASKLVG